jgi:hypothetical protein
MRFAHAPGMRVPGAPSRGTGEAEYPTMATNVCEWCDGVLGKSAVQATTVYAGSLTLRLDPPEVFCCHACAEASGRSRVSNPALATEEAA